MAGLRKITHTDPVELTSVETALTPSTEPQNGVATTDPLKAPTSSAAEISTESPVRAALRCSIGIKGLTASWSNDEGMPTLRNISLEVNEVSAWQVEHFSTLIPCTITAYSAMLQDSSFLAVVGRVGSGKVRE